MLNIELTNFIGPKKRFKFWLLSWMMLFSALVPILTFGYFDCNLYFKALCTRWYTQ